MTVSDASLIPERVLAIDWSGARDAAAQRRHIWTAEITEDDIQLSSKRTRDELCADLIRDVAGTPTVIGLDFAFSFPVSYFRANGLTAAGQLWKAAEEEGEAWLRECALPFWGRPGRTCPSTHSDEGFRSTDRELSIDGIRPKSPFQIGGAGAVGTGSIRGMPILAKLRSAGFSIWPFDPPHLPLVVEIYPRSFTGPVRKSSGLDRYAYIYARPILLELPEHLRLSIARSEDAFDALLSALGMWDSCSQFSGVQQASDPVELLEGRIWTHHDFHVH